MPDPAEPKDTVAAPRGQAPSTASSADETSPHAGSARPKFAPPTAEGEVGTLGPYRVLKQLGAGGMGAVYLALDTRIGRKIALKVMLPGFAADADAKARFLREASAAGNIAHDNIVIVHEADERDGVPYIVMPLLQGYPLDEYLKTKGSPPLPHILRIARETALGLAAAHQLGLVHRDIKPANLWLESPNGRVKILDFGLAKPLGADTELTKSGAVVGTPAYMSPEQARGLKVDHRADLFSLGAVLYRLCTGRTPFAGPNVLAVLAALLTDDPTPVRDLNPDVPEPLAQLVHQLLAKHPEHRPQTAAEVAERLRAVRALISPVAPAGDSAPIATVQEAPASRPVGVTPLPHHPPVAAPLSVTARPENAFAHLTDVSAADEDATEVESRPAPPKKRRPRGLLIAGGVAALAVVVAVVAVAAQGKKTPVAEKPPEPGLMTPTPKERPRQPNAPPAATDRAAAQHVLKLGGRVTVTTADGDKGVGTARDLPTDPFVVVVIDLSNLNDKLADGDLAPLNGLTSVRTVSLHDAFAITDAGLAHLSGMSALETLTLGFTKVTGTGLIHAKGVKQLQMYGTPITENGVKQIARLEHLAHLSLNTAKVTDAALAHLTGMPALVHLDLSDTAITDAGLERLAGLSALSVLHLKNTQVTGAGVAAFQKARPKCNIFTATTATKGDD